MKLYQDLHLRLTKKGVTEAVKVPQLTPEASPTTKPTSLNAFLSSFPRHVEIQNLVDCLQTAYNVITERASLDPSVADFASVHLQFQNSNDFSKLLSMSTTSPTVLW